MRNPGGSRQQPNEGNFNERYCFESLRSDRAALLPFCAVASSHREAPAIAGQPRVDGTDFYMFRSYEPGRGAYVTLHRETTSRCKTPTAAQLFQSRSEPVYKIHVDNDGDAASDLTFEFRFTNSVKDLTVNAGGQQIPIPLINSGPSMRRAQLSTSKRAIRHGESPR